jgi:hypothetical protein
MPEITCFHRARTETLLLSCCTYTLIHHLASEGNFDSRLVQQGTGHLRASLWKSAHKNRGVTILTSMDVELRTVSQYSGRNFQHAKFGHRHNLNGGQPKDEG